MRAVCFISAFLLLLGLGGCSGSKPKEEPPPPRVAYRQSPPEPVYGRLMWSHLPDPVKPKSTDDAPLLLPTVDFEMPNTTLGEAVEALAATMGYKWDYPPQVSKRKIHLKMQGSVQDVLQEIGRQGRVRAVFDHQRRLVRVGGEEVQPSLPY